MTIEPKALRPTRHGWEDGATDRPTGPRRARLYLEPWVAWEHSCVRRLLVGASSTIAADDHTSPVRGYLTAAAGRALAYDTGIPVTELPRVIRLMTCRGAAGLTAALPAQFDDLTAATSFVRAVTAALAIEDGRWVEPNDDPEDPRAGSQDRRGDDSQCRSDAPPLR